MFEIVPMGLEHLDGVFGIEQASFTSPWSYDSLRKEIAENKTAYYFAAVKDGAVAGYCGLWHIVNEGHITNVAVAHAYRRRGVGSALIGRLIRFAREKEMVGLTLEVRAGNVAAQQMYVKHGFKAEGVRKGYYSDTKEDAVIMWKML